MTDHPRETQHYIEASNRFDVVLASTEEATERLSRALGADALVGMMPLAYQSRFFTPTAIDHAQRDEIGYLLERDSGPWIDTLRAFKQLTGRIRLYPGRGLPEPLRSLSDIDETLGEARRGAIMKQDRYRLVFGQSGRASAAAAEAAGAGSTLISVGEADLGNVSVDIRPYESATDLLRMLKPGAEWPVPATAETKYRLASWAALHDSYAVRIANLLAELGLGRTRLPSDISVLLIADSIEEAVGVLQSIEAQETQPAELLIGGGVETSSLEVLVQLVRDRFGDEVVIRPVPSQGSWQRDLDLVTRIARNENLCLLQGQMALGAGFLTSLAAASLMSDADVIGKARGAPLKGIQAPAHQHGIKLHHAGLLIRRQHLLKVGLPQAPAESAWDSWLNSGTTYATDPLDFGAVK